MTPHILVVDDEDDIVELLEYNLASEGYRVSVARDGIEAMKKAQQDRPDLIILDVLMPRMGGIEFCDAIRQDARLRTIPILMLTAMSEEEDHVRGLEVGADIYLTKPISLPVLVSQTKALLRSSERIEDPPDRIQIHDLDIDRDRYRVFRNTNEGVEEIRLPRKEFELLFALASRPGIAYTRQDLLDLVWGTDVLVVDRTVDVHVRKIREKIGDDYIETIKGVGYRFKD
ncbi:MAG: response regulator transcription factor [Rhodothermales bacterium]|nr:response regulator transcription factor [Rhodothermales bacterium]